MTLKTTTFCLDSYTLSKETGFYYLQSRYYDPIVKRFLNADSYGSTGQGFLGYNMFAYCGNGPIIKSDPKGEDAVILEDTNHFCHLGSLIQDKDGNWYHYYWGSIYAGESSSIFCCIGITTPARESISNYYVAISLDEINKNASYGGDYENMLYLVGDFSGAFDYFREHKGEVYDLYKNNCSQRSLNALASCGTEHSRNLREAAKKVLPSSAFINMLFADLAPKKCPTKNVEITK